MNPTTTQPPTPPPLNPDPSADPLPLLFPLPLKSVCLVGRTPSGIVPLCVQRSHWLRRVDAGRRRGRGMWRGGGDNCKTLFEQFRREWGAHGSLAGATQDGAGRASHDLTDPLSPAPTPVPPSSYTQPILRWLRSRTTTEMSDGERTACLLARRRGARCGPVRGQGSAVN